MEAKDKVPEWMDLDLIEVFLGRQCKVTSFSVAPASTGGDGFLALLYRVHVDLENGDSEAIVVKAMAETPEMRDFIEKFKAFPKEIVVYRDLIPQFEKTWFQYTKEELHLGPKCWYTQEEPMNIIVLADLNEQGYKLLPPTVGLGLTESKLVLEKLAKFHACSVKTYEEKGSYDMVLFGEGSARRELQTIFEDYYDGLFDYFILGVENNVKCGSKYLPKLRKWRGKVYDLVLKLTQVDPKGFNVLNHGDLWMNNIMFKKDGEKVDALLIDFQLSHWTTPAVDLLFFLFHNLTTDIITSQFDHLIEFYHGILIKSMAQIKCKTPPPSLEAIVKDVHDKAFFGAMVIIESVALMKYEPRSELNLELLTKRSPEAEELKKKLFASPKYVELLEVLLPFCNSRGFLDIEHLL